MIALLLLACGQQQQHTTPDPISSSFRPAVLVEEFIYEVEDAKTPQCHASTIAASGEWLVAAWFGGTAEKNKDVGIWLSRHDGQRWSEPVEVVNGVQDEQLRYPCWNPVLFQARKGPLMLFYKVGPNPREWWGMLTTSADQGASWSEPVRLPEGIYGPIKNKPIQLASGELLCPTSTEHDGWKVQIERTPDLGKSWSSTGDLNDGKTFAAIQPTILNHGHGVLQILCRTRQGVISQCWSEDNGHSWSAMTATDLPNPNSGIDAVSLKDGRHLLVYNPTGGDWGHRVPLSVAISSDGHTWTRLFDLEPLLDPETAEEEEYSYPSIIQAPDGKVHIVYTWNRQTVKHVVLDPTRIQEG
ncbi:MAG: sialidase [Bacteroidetes bacterium]|nr:MAG: sialidase [Bacteroidota bacterium]